MKKIISICFLLVLALFPFMLVGCGTNYGKSDIASLYSEVLSYVGDDDGFITVGINESKAIQNSNRGKDKGYIFPLCYDNFLSASAGLFFGVGARHNGDITYTLREFNQDELNAVYEKLKVVRDASIVVASNKSIFEKSNGNLNYRDLVVSCNDLIEKLNALNDTFSPLYFSHYFTGYTAGDLSDGELKDVLFYGIQSFSFVSYNYELKNFEFSNPYGEVKTWYDGTALLKTSNGWLSSTLSKLREDNLTDSMSIETKNQIIAILQRIQNEKEGYASDFASYKKALNEVDIAKYLKSTNKTAYKQDLSAKEQSCFEIIDRFLEGRYRGLCNALDNIVETYL